MKDYPKRNWAVILLFLVSTFFFVFQHSQNLSWDFSVYSLNAQYWFGAGYYFELLRPPLTSLVMGIFSIFGWKAAEYLYIISISTLFAYSSYKLADSLDFNPVLYYALSLSPFVLFSGLKNGSELLYAGLLQFSIMFLARNNSFSGLFLGLGALARYTNLALLPILLLHLKKNKVMKSILLFGAALIPWLAYNKLKFGNFLTSIADQYANNILYRGNIEQSVSLSHFINVQSILIPFFLIGLSAAILKLAKEIKSKKKIKFLEDNRVEIAMTCLLGFFLITFIRIPVKDPRLLFPILIPTAYFAYIGVETILRRMDWKEHSTAASIIFLVMSLLIAVNSLYDDGLEKPDNYEAAISELEALNKTECAVMSDSFVFLNYLGKDASPLPQTELWDDYIEEGNTLIAFKNNTGYEIMDGGCAPQRPFNTTYLELTDEYIYRLHGYRINTNPCFILFHDYGIFERTCNLANSGSFRIDRHRVLE